jgi:hypothetical protein
LPETCRANWNYQQTVIVASSWLSSLLFELPFSYQGNLFLSQAR